MKAGKSKPRPRYYFCFRSPYSWIASRLLREHLTVEEQCELEYRPFWQPDAHSLAEIQQRGGEFLFRPMSRERHLYILQDVKRLAISLGFSHTWPIDENPRWELPNLAWLAADRAGEGAAFRDAVFKARWENGENIHCVDVVQRIASDVGLNGPALVAAIESPEIHQLSIEALMRCYDDGVFGVPFFVLGTEKFWGADRVEMLLAKWRGRSFHFLAC